MRRLLLFVFLALAEIAGAQTPTFVQGQVLDGSSNGAAVSSVSVTFGGTGTTAGNAMILRLGNTSTTADFNGCTDDNGNGYSLAVQKTSAAGAWVAIAYATNVVGGAVKITCKTTGGHSFFSMYAEEWSNTYAVSVVDNTANATCSSTTSVSYTLTISLGSDALFAVTNWSGGSGTKTVGAGWTSHNSTALAAIGTEDQVAGASGNYTTALSWTSSTSCASAAAAFFAGVAPPRAFAWKSNVFQDNSSIGTAFTSVSTGGNLLTVSAGNGVMVWIDYVSTTLDTPGTPCNDDLGNSYTLATQCLNSNGSGAVSAIAYALNVTGGASQHVTCTLSHAHSFFSVYAAEFTGLGAGAALDATGCATANSTAISKSVTTASDTELAIVAPNWASAHGTLTLGTNMFSHSTTLFVNLGEEDFITGTAGSYTGAINYATSGQSVLAIATFKGAVTVNGYFLRAVTPVF